jgi:hypothetical protein
MFDNPEIMRQLVDGRIDQRRRQAAARRTGASLRRRHHRRLRIRMVRPTWFVRRRPDVCAPDHAPA